MFDVNNIRKDFPIIANNPELIYFDSGATTFKPQCVIDSVDNYYLNKTSNIHRGDYDMSFDVSKKYDETRKLVKDFLNAKKDEEIVFTSGATASLNTVIYGIAHTLKEGDTILTTLVEHASNILPLFRIAKDKKLNIKYIPLNEDGTFNINEYEKCFDSSVKLVCMSYVSNVLGYKYPIKDICTIAHKNNALVLVDGSQAVPHIKVNVSDLDVDFLSFSAHKMLGPSGVGVLYGKYNLLKTLDPLTMGGGANARFDKEGNIILKEVPEVFEAGTPNIEGVLGLNGAIRYLSYLDMKNIEEYDNYLIKYMMSKLTKLDNVEVYNPNADCAIASFNVKGIFAQDVGSYLNKYHIAVRTGNHCAKVLHNIIGTDQSIRASLYLYNTTDEIDKFIDVLKDCTLEKCIGAII